MDREHNAVDGCSQDADVVERRRQRIRFERSEAETSGVVGTDEQIASGRRGEGVVHEAVGEGVPKYFSGLRGERYGPSS